MGSSSSNIKLHFTKMAGAGNDFIMVDNISRPINKDWSAFAVRYCAPKTGVGADGVIILDKDSQTDFTFRIFNADGSEAEMCGNGARCAALFAHQKGIAGNSMHFRTLAGIIGARLDGNDAAIEMTEPSGLQSNIDIDVPGRPLKVHFINTGVPHTIIFSGDILKEPVAELGRAVRYHDRFAPAGTNADFVQVIGPDRIHVRTYERGVEGETLACGTGAVASAIMADHLGMVSRAPVNVTMKGGELKIDFTRDRGLYTGVWLMGPVDTVFTGELVMGS